MSLRLSGRGESGLGEQLRQGVVDADDGFVGPALGQPDVHAVVVLDQAGWAWHQGAARPRRAGGKVMMTSAERTAVASITFAPKVITLTGTNSNADNANIRAAISAIEALGGGGEIQMSGDFKIGYSGDKTGIDPGTRSYLKLTGRGYWRWWKGVAATTTGLVDGDPVDGTAYRMLNADTDHGAGRVLIISNIIFEGDLATTMKQSRRRQPADSPRLL